MTAWMNMIPMMMGQGGGKSGGSSFKDPLGSGLLSLGRSLQELGTGMAPQPEPPQTLLGGQVQQPPPSPTSALPGQGGMPGQDYSQAMGGIANMVGGQPRGGPGGAGGVRGPARAPIMGK